MNTPTLSPAEALILEQLREKPSQVRRLQFGDNIDTLTLWKSWADLSRRGLFRIVRYVQQWRCVGYSDVCHLTHEGRLALIKHEESKGRKVVTHFANPPIPDRSMDWYAYYDGEEEKGQYGTGRTEADAIADLRSITEDEEDCPYDCPDCGKKLTVIKGYWGCLCKFGGGYPTAAQVEELADREEGAV